MKRGGGEDENEKGERVGRKRSEGYGEKSQDTRRAAERVRSFTKEESEERGRRTETGAASTLNDTHKRTLSTGDLTHMLGSQCPLCLTPHLPLIITITSSHYYTTEWRMRYATTTTVFSRSVPVRLSGGEERRGGAVTVASAADGSEAVRAQGREERNTHFRPRKSHPQHISTKSGHSVERKGGRQSRGRPHTNNNTAITTTTERERRERKTAQKGYSTANAAPV